VKDTPIGTLSFNGSFTKILGLKRNLLPGAPLNNALDTIGEQISSRGRFAAGLSKDGFSGLFAANYIGGYLNNLTPTVAGVRVPNQNIPSWTTFDLTLTYASQAKGGLFAGTRFTLNAQNMFDMDPPLVLSTQAQGGVPTATDLNVHNVFGRILTFEISKSF
jgi:iron complex outermembrane receptor protein